MVNHLEKANIIVTGSAGFIGFFLSKRLLEAGHSVTGIDNLNDYYDVNLKTDRLELLKAYGGFKFFKGDISSKDDVQKVFKESQPEI